MDDILVSASLVRANIAGNYLEMRKEDTLKLGLNGSDHRAVILHLDTGTFLGMGPPRAMQDNVKVRIQTVTSTLEHRECSNTAQAYMGEIYAMLGADPQTNPSWKDNTVGKRVKDATSAYKEVKTSGEGLPTATNILSNATDKILVEAANTVAGANDRLEAGTLSGRPRWQSTRWH